jgi:hypothetical protein
MAQSGEIMSSESVLLGILFIGFILFLIYQSYMGRKYKAETDIRNKQEMVNAEVSNVCYSAAKYKREVLRAKELLSLGLHAIESQRIDLDDSDNSGNRNIALAMSQMGRSDNFFTLLIETMRTMGKAEDDLLCSIERSNSRLASLNAYIQTPIFPRMVAGEIGIHIQPYDEGRLLEIDNQINIRLTEINRMEASVSGIMGSKIPKTSLANFSQPISDQDQEDNCLEFYS